MLDEKICDNIARNLKCQKGSIIYYNGVTEYYNDILRIEKSDNNTLKIVCVPNYDIDSVLHFAKYELAVGVDYEIVVEDKYEALK